MFRNYFAPAKEDRRHIKRQPVPAKEVIDHYNEIASSPNNDLTTIRDNANVDEIHEAINKLSQEDQDDLYRKFKGQRKQDYENPLEIEDRSLRNYIIKLILTVTFVTIAIILIFIAYAFIKATNPADLSSVIKEMVDTFSEILGVIIDPPNK